MPTFISLFRNHPSDSSFTPLSFSSWARNRMANENTWAECPNGTWLITFLNSFEIFHDVAVKAQYNCAFETLKNLSSLTNEEQFLLVRTLELYEIWYEQPEMFTEEEFKIVYSKAFKIESRINREYSVDQTRKILAFTTRSIISAAQKICNNFGIQTTLDNRSWSSACAAVSLSLKNTDIGSPIFFHDYAETQKKFASIVREIAPWSMISSAGVF